MIAMRASLLREQEPVAGHLAGECAQAKCSSVFDSNDPWSIDLAKPAESYAHKQLGGAHVFALYDHHGKDTRKNTPCT